MQQKDDILREAWDQLVILLASRPREGWEEVFEEIARRELERLSVLRSAQLEGDDE
jgi:hypothetical protein